jgi:hypothetical protein
MEDRIEMIANNQNEWVAPVLKKIDVEEITQADGFFTDDGDGQGPSSS